jgi:hypothetical protein
LNRWVLKLSEYDFEIQHRPGSKHINEDVLSRHVAAVVQDDSLPEGSGQGDNGVEASSYLSKETIRKAQGSDEFCQKIIHSLNIEEDIPYFLDQDSVLYYGTPEVRFKGKAKIVVPAALIEQVIQQHHDPVFAGHQGVKRTQNCLKLHYFWPTLAKRRRKLRTEVCVICNYERG